MKVSPIGDYRTPKYPTRRIVDEHPELLRLLPKRWAKNPLVLSTLAGACALTLGVRAAYSGAPDASRVAPVFQHGVGRAGFGCMVINPPVFLSEDEARQVISEEAAKAGVTFKPDAATIKRIPVPSTKEQPRPGETSDQPVKGKIRRIPITLDGVDGKLHIAYEYVSMTDYDEWKKFNDKDYPQRIVSSVYEVNTVGAATSLRESLAKAKPKDACAVFYEPMSRGADSDTWETNKEEARKDAREQLRLQVRDFIGWLKTQGVI